MCRSFLVSADRCVPRVMSLVSHLLERENRGGWWDGWRTRSDGNLRTSKHRWGHWWPSVGSWVLRGECSASLRSGWRSIAGWWWTGLVHWEWRVEVCWMEGRKTSYWEWSIVASQSACTLAAIKTAITKLAQDKAFALAWVTVNVLAKSEMFFIGCFEDLL